MDFLIRTPAITIGDDSYAGLVEELVFTLVDERSLSWSVALRLSGGADNPLWHVLRHWQAGNNQPRRLVAVGREARLSGDVFVKGGTNRTGDRVRLQGTGEFELSSLSAG